MSSPLVERKSSLSRLLRRLILTLSVCLSCPAPQHFPGSELIGTFNFNATPISNNCSSFIQADDGGFTFSGTFSHDASGSAWFTVEKAQGGSLSGRARVDRGASFDGQYVVSSVNSPRKFDECGCPTGMQVDETLRVALLSPTQRDAVGGSCPSNALDGGVPAPDGEAIQPPRPRGYQFDAVLACGELVDSIYPTNPVCLCSPCTMVMALSGTATAQ